MKKRSRHVLPEPMTGRSMDHHFPERVILHCSFSPDTLPHHPNFDDYGAADIEKIHIKEKGFKEIGYHYVIRRSGEIEKGRDNFTEGNHTFAHNYRSVGICLIGTRFFTSEQLTSLEDLCIELRYEYGLAPEEWYGHCEYDPEHKPNCPGLDIQDLRDRLRGLFGKGNRGSVSNNMKRLGDEG